MLPAGLRSDFQDFAAWRQGVHEVLDLILRSADGPVIGPLTLVEPSYLAEVIGRLTSDGHDVRHLALLAEARVIERRLRERAVVHAIQRPRGRDAIASARVQGQLGELFAAVSGETGGAV